MSSSVSPTSASSKGFISELTAFVPPIASAAFAITPTFWLFKIKSAQQAGDPISRFTVTSSLKDGIKAAPFLGAVVGVQLKTEKFVKEKLFEIFQLGTKEERGFWLSFTSSAIVGALSAPLWTVFNARTMNIPLKKAFKNFPKQALAISFRETAFLIPLSYQPKNTGDSKIQEYFMEFMKGAAISACGHPADTLSTLWQKGKNLQNISQLKNGLVARATGVGLFTVLYKFGNETIK